MDFWTECFEATGHDCKSHPESWGQLDNFWWFEILTFRIDFTLNCLSIAILALLTMVNLLINVEPFWAAGEVSYIYMKGIVLKLADLQTLGSVDVDSANHVSFD